MHEDTFTKDTHFSIIIYNFVKRLKNESTSRKAGDNENDSGNR